MPKQPRATRSTACVLIGVAVLASAVTSAAAGGTKATVRNGGTLVVNGTPVFPVGFYHVSWVKNRTGQGLRDDLLTISRSGFSFIHPTIDLRADSALFLELAAERKVWVLPEVNRKILEPVIERYREQPAIIAWNIGDDVTGKGKPDEIEAANRLVKRLAPDHLTYVSAYNSGEPWLKSPGVEVWMKAGVDLVGMQCYTQSPGTASTAGTADSITPPALTPRPISGRGSTTARGQRWRRRGSSDTKG